MHTGCPVITSEQLRAGRALVRWRQKELADAAGISVATLKRLEAGKGPLKTSAVNMHKLQSLLADAGVEFIDENGGGSGVRLRK